MSKIELLRNILKQYNIDGYIITSTDEWQNEYSFKPRLSYISGFSGSNGTLIVTQKDLILYTDSRYIIQAKAELSEEYIILDMHKEFNCRSMNICTGLIIGYDPMILSLREKQYYEKLSIKYNFKLEPIDDNIVDILMDNNNIDIVEISGDDAVKLCNTVKDSNISEAYEEYIEDIQNNYNFAAKIDNNDYGIISLKLNHNTNGNIDLLKVASNKNYIEIATALINHIMKFALANGIQTLTVQIIATNQLNDDYLKSYNIYKQCGFKDLFKLQPEGCSHEMLYMVKVNLKSMRKLNEHSSEVMILPNRLTGQSSDDKLSRILLPENCDYLLLTSPESISWLLNLRGKDIKYNTSVLSYCIIGKSTINLFVNIASINHMIDNHEIVKIDNNLKDNLDIQKFKVIIEPISQFKKFLLKNKHKTFALDKNSSSAWITEHLSNIQDFTDPTVKMRSIKNKTELEGIKLAHKLDGIAICKFWFWLYNFLRNGEKIDEIIAAKKLAEFKQMSMLFLYESFATISAYGANGAIIHYHPKVGECKAIPSTNSDYVYLLDSGGQYLSAGTTDITRVFDIGKIFGVNKYEHKKAYTLVLKGHINLARALFPIGTTGSQLDVLARYNLWQHGIDYQHGTGHGVGHFLSVHEGPYGIAKKNNIVLEENMILSIEPGYYKEGSFGIRIENLYIVKKSNTFDKFLQFELLTMVPIETSLVDLNLLTREEIEWLKKHNQITIETISNHLTSEEVAFLMINSKVQS